MAVNTDPVVPGEAPVGGEAAVTFPVPPAAPTRPRVSVSDAVVMPEAEARGAAVQQEATRDTASKWESAKAGYDQWAHKSIYKWMTTPDFAPDPTYDHVGRLEAAPIMFSPDEEDFVMSGSDAEFDFKLERILEYRKASQAMGDNPITGFVTMALDPTYIAADIATGGAARALGVGRAAARALAFTGGAAAATGIGLAESQVKPMSDTEIILNGLANGAGAALFVGPAGKLVKRNPSFPGAALKDVVESIQPKVPAKDVEWVPHRDANGDVVTNPDTGAPVMKTVDLGDVRTDTPIASVQVPKIIDEVADVAADLRRTMRDADDALARLRTDLDAAVPPPSAAVPPATPAVTPTPKPAPARKTFRKSARTELQAVIDSASPEEALIATQMLKRMGPMADEIRVRRDAKVTRSYYDPNDHSIHLRPNAEPRIVNHEMSHALTVAKYRYGKRKPNSTHGAIVKELDEIRAIVSKAAGPNHSAAYFLNQGEEFIAGLYELAPDFIKLLRETPDPRTRGRTSVLSSFVDALRRMLGYGADETDLFTKSLQLSEELQDIKLSYTMSGQPAYGPGSRTKPSQPLKLSYEPTGGTVPAQVTPQVIDAQLTSLAQRNARSVEWSLSKTLRKYSDKVSRLLVDDPLDKRGNSAESYRRSIRANLATLQYGFEDILKDEMKKRGIGVRQRVFQPQKSMDVQKGLERQVGLEMLRRGELSRQGVTNFSSPNVPKEITDMADALQKVADGAVAEMQRAGVLGADALEITQGYFSRKWSPTSLDSMEDAISKATGLPTQGPGRSARTVMRELMADAIKAANPWDDELASDVAGAILDRARRKGNLSDREFKGHIGNENLVGIRDELERALGTGNPRVQRVMDTLSGVVEDANKASYLKDRVQMDVFTSMTLPDGTKISISDLINTDMANITEAYLDDVAGRSALAKVGLGTEKAIQDLRTEMIEGMKHMDQGEIRKAGDLFDNTIKALRGQPIGERMEDFLRMSSAATQMVGLSSSGLWQLTEYAKIMQHYGLSQSMKHIVKELPFVRNFAGMSRDDVSSLQSILARNSAQDVRMRPFLHKLEDNYLMPQSASVEMALNQAKQLVPYINAMKWIHGHQARVSANLITDTVVRGAKGDAAALKVLEKYGLDPQLVDRVKADINRHGTDTSLWSDDTFDLIRNPLNRMVDDDVLRSRLGELPAFAQFSQLGKFIFTFRSFVLGAHNKVMAGTLHSQGYAGLSLMLAYQFPATLMATQANQVIAGKEPLAGDEWVAAGIAQMGGLGMFTDVFGALAQNKQQFGSPGTIAIDRAFRVVSELGQMVGGAVEGDFKPGGLTNSLLTATPILSLVPGVKAFGNAISQE